MRFYDVRRHIAADVAAVWATLTDAGRLLVHLSWRILPDFRPSFDATADGVPRATEVAR